MMMRKLFWRGREREGKGKRKRKFRGKKRATVA
jgi:hypothetical protein